MKAMLLEQFCTVAEDSAPLHFAECPEPICRDHEVLIQVRACGVCHTELDEIEGRTRPPRLPMVLGHQVVGQIVEVGSQVNQWVAGDRVGVAWIFSACGGCDFCRSGRENLCANFEATGRDHFGGYAQLMCAPANFVFRIPNSLPTIDAAPLLCAGAIGYRSLRLTNLTNGQNLGLMGFGASAHLVLKMARHKLPATKVFVFARSERERDFARDLGATWAGSPSERSPIKLDAIIDTTPAWRPILDSLDNLAPGGRLVVNAIRKEEADKSQLLRFDYTSHLWMEKEIKSVANVARQDVQDLLTLCSEIDIRPETRTFPLVDANQALIELKMKSVPGAKVLVIE